jgi:dTMP kinase
VGAHNVMTGRLITFEGTEGCGKSTQLRLLADRLQAAGLPVVDVREPGGTPIGEEIRHTLQHSDRNQAMTPEAELLLINASRAQLVREIIRPALARGNIVLCDRFYDSTTAYQAYGRGLDAAQVRQVIDLAVGPTRPDLTLLLRVPVEIGEARRQRRPGGASVRDRMEEAGARFFGAVVTGFDRIAAAEPSRILVIDGTRTIAEVAAAVWDAVRPMFPGDSNSRFDAVDRPPRFKEELLPGDQPR